MPVEEVSKSVELMVTGAVTLCSSFVGAFLAFVFNKRQQAGALELSHVEACNGALIVLARQYSLLRNHYDQHLKANKDSPGRHLNNDALLELRPAHSAVDLPALTFLLGTSARDVVMEISVLDAIFRNCVDTINMRSLFHREQYQPALEIILKKQGTTRLPGSTVTAEIGDRLNFTLKRITDDIYSLVLDALPRFETAGASLQAAFKGVFPNHTIIKFEPIRPDDRPSKEAALARPDYRQRPGYRDW